MNFWGNEQKVGAARSEKRIAVVFLFLAVGLLVVILSLFTASGTKQYEEAALQQSTYTLQVASTRGTIYDTNLTPLVNENANMVAAVAPSTNAANAITAVFPSDRIQEIYTMLTAGTPFLLSIPEGVCVSGEGIDLFTVPERYSETSLAVHTIGYTDADGNGVTGIELAFDDVLRENSGAADVQYSVDAVNRVIAFQERTVTDTLSKSRGGVVLTLDKEIQKIAENSAKKYLKKGAVVVTEVATGKIRAIVSLPSFSPEDVAAALEKEDAPLLDRALASYNVGSVFKLVAAAAALEYGISDSREYTCTGGHEVSGAVFHCFDETAHGTIDMKSAIAESCNGYFIDLMQSVPIPSFLKMAEALGFGKSLLLTDGISSATGVLPTEESLRIPRALANFSFGQGELTASPVQIASLTNTIASGGIYTALSLVEGTIGADGKWKVQDSDTGPCRVMKSTTALCLQAFMKESVHTGTAAHGAPAFGGAGAKTGTAQTGIFREGEEVLELWYTGFFPEDQPQYTITVLADDRTAKERSPCAEVFREIADVLNQ